MRRVQHSNPYVSQEPAIGNNGDLSGGHLNHTGPVYPADGWGDIIPPYQYVDENGVLQTFPGYNWGEGQAIYANGCDLPAPPEPEPVTPVLECVEAAESGFLAHFGYTNPNATTIRAAFEPELLHARAADRDQPESFGHGAHSDVFQVSWDGSALTWNLTGRSVTASSGSNRCAGGSLTVNKHLLPANDPGRFNLKIDGNIEGRDRGRGRWHHGHDRRPERHAHRERVGVVGHLARRLRSSDRLSWGWRQRRRRRAGERTIARRQGVEGRGDRLHDHERGQGERGGRLARSELRGLRRDHARPRRLGLLQQVGRTGGHPDRRRQPLHADPRQSGPAGHVSAGWYAGVFQTPFGAEQ